MDNIVRPTGELGGPTPADRFDAAGQYDPASYDDDLLTYPEFFDRNGWPLFGNADPYALTHPMTRRPWYEAPRVPTAEELDLAYESWFVIAEQFGEYTDRLLTVQLDPTTKRAPPPPEVLARYSPMAKAAVKGNLAYNRSTLLPQLRHLLARRELVPELVILFAELAQLAQTTPLALRATKTRHSRGAPHDRTPQVKWYIHFRRRCGDQGLSVRQANLLFRKVAKDVAFGKLMTPEGFDRKFFERALGRAPGNPNKAIGGLSDALKRAFNRPDWKDLEKASPDADPAIPPIDHSAYLPNLGVHKRRNP